MDRFELLSHVINGATGSIFRARDKETGEIVCAKRVDLRLLTSPDSVSAVRQEVRVLRDLWKDPGAASAHILRHIASFEHEQHLFLITPFHQRGTLATLIEANREAGVSIPQEQVLAVCQQLAVALSFLHERAIIHRDIKPQNVFVESLSPLRVCLGDFGSLRLLAASGPTSLSQSLVGTPLTVAPEVIDGASYDVSADLWSLGVTVHHLCSGESPFTAGSVPAILLKVAAGDVPALPKRYSEVWRIVVGPCLCLNPERRPTASQLVSFLSRGVPTSTSLARKFEDLESLWAATPPAPERDTPRPEKETPRDDLRREPAALDTPADPVEMYSLRTLTFSKKEAAREAARKRIEERERLAGPKPWLKKGKPVDPAIALFTPDGPPIALEVEVQEDNAHDAEPAQPPAPQPSAAVAKLRGETVAPSHAGTPRKDSRPKPRPSKPWQHRRGSGAGRDVAVEIFAHGYTPADTNPGHSPPDSPRALVPPSHIPSPTLVTPIVPNTAASQGTPKLSPDLLEEDAETPEQKPRLDVARLRSFLLGEIGSAETAAPVLRHLGHRLAAGASEIEILCEAAEHRLYVIAVALEFLKRGGTL